MDINPGATIEDSFWVNEFEVIQLIECAGAWIVAQYNVVHEEHVMSPYIATVNRGKALGEFSKLKRHKRYNA